MNNRLWNITNPYQGSSRRVLCVCSAGLLRSPTAAWVLSNPPWNYNTRAVGVDTDHALVPIDHALIQWAQEIVVMEERHATAIGRLMGEGDRKDLVVLGIPDKYGYRDPELVRLISERYKAAMESDVG